MLILYGTSFVCHLSFCSFLNLPPKLINHPYYSKAHTVPMPRYVRYVLCLKYDVLLVSTLLYMLYICCMCTLVWRVGMLRSCCLTSQSRMASMASRLLPCRSWKWTTSRAAFTSAASLACPGPHSRIMSWSSRLYLLILCTGLSRYDHRSILSSSFSCFC